MNMHNKNYILVYKKHIGFAIFTNSLLLYLWDFLSMGNKSFLEILNGCLSTFMATTVQCVNFHANLPWELVQLTSRFFGGCLGLTQKSSLLNQNLLQFFIELIHLAMWLLEIDQLLAHLSRKLTNHVLDLGQVFRDRTCPTLCCLLKLFLLQNMTYYEKEKI